MVDITHKSNSLRTAIAVASVKVSKPSTIIAIRENKVPKGNVLEVARTAGLFAAKRTSDMIPDCHPLPIEFTSVRYDLMELEIRIEVEIRTIYKTGVEVEAMHAASVVALTMYDMLKPIDKSITIEQLKLIQKKGGKSDFQNLEDEKLNAAVIVCSDAVFSGEKLDSAGKCVVKKLTENNISIYDYTIIPDDHKEIQDTIHLCCSNEVPLIIICGGTGLSKRDNTPEALIPLLDRRIPGIEEAIRSYGQQRTPNSMLSRCVAGLIGKTMIIAMPGSTRGAEESMNAIFPALRKTLHRINVKR